MAKKKYEDYLKELQEKSKNLKYQPGVNTNKPSNNNRQEVINTAKKNNIAIDENNPLLMPTIQSVSKKNNNRYTEPSSGFSSIEKQNRNQLQEEQENFKNKVQNTLAYEKYRKEQEERQQNEKSLDDKIAQAAKNILGGAWEGTVNYVTSKTSELKNDINKAKKEGIIKNALDLMNATKNITNPASRAVDYLTETTKNAYNSATDKTKTTKQKLGSYATKQVTIGKNTLTNPFSSAANESAQVASNIIGAKNSEKVYKGVEKAENKINAPVDEYNRKLQEENAKYGTKEQYLFGALNQVGNMLPSIATTAATGNPTLGLEVMGSSAKGASIKEALAKGADLEQAIDIGNTKGAIEKATEMISGGVNIFGKGAIDDIVERGINKAVKNKVANFLIKRGIVDNAGEIAEETISDILGTLIDQGTVDPNAKYSIKDWSNTAITTVLSTLALNALTGGYGSTAFKQNAANIAQQTALDNINFPTAETLKNNPNTQTKLSDIRTQIQNDYNQINITDDMTLEDSLKAYGIEMNDAWKTINDITEKRGIKAIVNDQYFMDNSEPSLYVKDANGNRTMAFNPYADPETIIQSKAVHELAHDLISSENSRNKLLGIKSNQSISDSDIFKFVESLEGYQEARKNLEEIYSTIKDKNGNLVYDPNSAEFKELIDEEVVAHSLEKLGTQEFIDRLNGKKPNLARRIYNWVLDKIDNIGKSSEYKQEKAYWKDVAKRFEKAFNMEYNNSITEANTRLAKNNYGTALMNKYYNALSKTEWHDYLEKIKNNEIELSADKDTPTRYDDKIVFARIKYGKPQVVDAYELNKMTLNKLETTPEELFNIIDTELSKEGYSEGEIKRISEMLGSKALFNRYDTKSHTFTNTIRKYKRSNATINSNSSEVKNGEGTIGSNGSNEIRNNRELDSSFSSETKYSKEAKKWDEFKEKNLKPTGTTGTLMAIHNLSEDKLKGILELGGFPVPSIAITNPDIVNHNQFGDISVLFDKSTIDPAVKANEVYDRDVWSPTFPTIDNEIIQENLEKVANEIGIRDYYLEDALERNSNKDDLIDRLIREDGVAENYLEKNNVEYNREELNQKEIRELAKKNGIENYLDEQLKDVIGRKGIYNGKSYITDNGNRRGFWQLHDEYNLENLVKNLTKGKTTGTQQVLFGAGFGPTQANMYNQFKSISDIKNNENKIVSIEEQSKARTEYVTKLEEAMMPLRKYAVEGVYTSGYEQVYNVIQELSQEKNVNVKALKKILNEHDFNNVDKINEKVLQKAVDTLLNLKNLPTDYFEAKPQRAVGLDEVEAIVIPNNTTEEFRKALNDAGLDFVEYDPSVEGDRQRVINKFDNLKFSKNANGKWQDFVNQHFEPKGTTTKLGKVNIPIKKKPNIPIRETTNNPAINMPKSDKTMNPNEISKLTQKDADTTPKIPIKNRNVSNDGDSKFWDNILYKTDMLSNENKKAILSDTEVKKYDKVTNKESLEKAYEKLNKDGAYEANRWFRSDSKDATATDVAEGWILLKQYADRGDTQGMVEVAKKMRDIGTKAGQTVQAFNIMERMTPEGMVAYAQSELSEAYDNMIKNKSKAWIDKHKGDFELKPDEVQFIMDNMQEISKMEDGYDKRVKLAEIQKMMTDKLPVEKGRKIKSWMRISMLFNPKTQVRNVAGNAIIMPVNSFGDLFATYADKVIAKKSGVRTTGMTNVKALLKGIKKGAYEATNDFRKGINTRDMEGNRFEIGEGKSFSNKNLMGKSLNRVDGMLNYIMDVGDRVFSEAAFENSLQNQMKLNNTTEITQDMIDIARSEALQRTWNDNNNYTRFVLNVRKGLNKIGVKGYGLGDVLIPFAKTPANLTKAIVDYSPAGLVKTMVEGNNLRKALNNGQYTPQMQHQFVQDLGRATAGTMLYVLGAALAKSGVISGESDDDKDTKDFLKNTLGVNSYSIKVGDKSFTYDWAQPIAAPLSIMANIENKKDKEETALLEAALSSLDSASSILLEQSFLQSVNEVLTNNKGIASGIENVILDLPARSIPTFLKQLTDLTDSTQRQTFEYNQPLKTAVNKFKAKIPGLSETLAPKVDTMGREVQKYGGKNNFFNIFLNPANVNTENISEGAEEIYRLYKETGEKDIMPKVAPYYINQKDGEKIILNTKEIAEYQKISGDIVESSMKDLLNSTEYQNMSDTEKAEVVKDIVNYANNIAKNEVTGIELSKSYQKAYDYSKIGDVKDYYLLKDSIDKEDSSKEKKQKVVNYLMDSNLTNKQLAYLYGNYYSSEEELDNILNAGIPMKQFIKLDSQDFEGVFDESKGRTKTNSKKEEVLRYIDTLKLTAVQKAFLAKSRYSSVKGYDRQITQYIGSRNLSLLNQYRLLKYANIDTYDREIVSYIANSDMSQSKKEKLYKEMGFTVHNGRVYVK